VKRTTPKPFQESAVESGLAIFSECQRLLDTAGENAAGRAVAVAHHGALLIEAPTGGGKTLIAGHLAEGFLRGRARDLVLVCAVQGRDRADGFLAARRTARPPSPRVE